LISTLAVKDNGPGCDRATVRIAPDEEADLGRAQRFEREVVVAFRRVEFGRIALAVFQQGNDVGLAGILAPDDHVGRLFIHGSETGR
jgi:hypothetical protein